MIATDVRTEVMCRAAKESRRTRGRRDSARREGITRSNSALITASSPIAGCGEIRGTHCDNTVNRLGDDTVLEHGFGEVNHIVDHDFRAGCRKSKDVGGESGLPVERRGERKTCAWSDVMDNLQYRSALVGSLRADRDFLDNLHSRQVAAAHVGSGAA